MNNDLNSLYGNDSNENTNTNPNQSTGEDLNSMYNALMTPKVEEPQPTINNEPQNINNEPQNINEMQPSQSVINNQGLINPELQSNNSSQSNTLDNNNQFIQPQENTNMMNNPPIANQNNSMMTDNNSNNMFNSPNSISNQAIPNQQQEPNNNQDDNEEENLLEAFVGPAYLDFVNGGFNVGAFFLTSLYFFYRKMFLYGLAFFIGQIGLSIILKQFYFAFIVNLACGFLTNKIYIGFAKGKVKKLSKKYSGGELLSKCEEKGGTSVGLVILGVFAESILLIIVVFIMMFVMGAALFSSILGGVSIDSSRRSTMSDTFMQYVNEVKIRTAANEVICNNNKIGTLKDGTYYVEIDTSNGNSVGYKNYESLITNGGKSSWNNADLKGYIKIVKENNYYKFFINMSDDNHGTKQEISIGTILGNDIEDGVNYPTTPNGIKCSIAE